MVDRTGELQPKQPTRRGFLHAAILSVPAAILGMQIAKNYVLQGEDRGLDSLQGTPVNVNLLKDPSFHPSLTSIIPREDKRTIFRSSMSQDDKSLIPQDVLKEKWGVSPDNLHTIQLYGVPYQTSEAQHILGHTPVINPKTGKEETLGLWRQVVTVKENGTLDKRLPIYFPEKYAK